MIEKIKKFLNDRGLDGYIIPKNDYYFTEYSNNNNLLKVTNFTGSAGFAFITKKKNFLFVDGRYTLQAKRQSGAKFIIKEIPKYWPKNVIIDKNFKVGFDPKLFTKSILNKYFGENINLIPNYYNFSQRKKNKIHKFYFLSKNITGEDYTSKINRLLKILKKNKIENLYISAGENICWLLNIRGKDLPHSPLANCKMIITSNKKIYFFSDISKSQNLKQKFGNIINFHNENELFKIIINLSKKNFCIDKNTCSVFDQQLINSNFNITSFEDPIYKLKSIKNKTEINNMIKAHIIDGVAVTKFLYWFKNNKKVCTEKIIERKLENLRKKSIFYLYPSFDTIAGSGPNGAIIHYRSNNQTNRKILDKDLLLIDSGGQYQWGTTDVTRTTSKSEVSQKIKNNFTRVLKGHIAVIKCNISKNFNGHLIDKLARKFLNKVGLNYSHGTGHGVGFFLNVHEGPQNISKYNYVPLKEGMILSNEPGYYLENKYGIRIENLIYIFSKNKELRFKNLTYVPIDLDLINFKMLTNIEKKYLFEYHLEVYNKISKFLNENERKWLISLIK